MTHPHPGAIGVRLENCYSTRTLSVIWELLRARSILLYFVHLRLTRRELGTFVLKLLCDKRQRYLSDPDGPEAARLDKEVEGLVYALYGLTPEEIAIVEGKR